MPLVCPLDPGFRKSDLCYIGSPLEAKCFINYVLSFIGYNSQVEEVKLLPDLSHSIYQRLQHLYLAAALYFPS